MLVIFTLTAVRGALKACVQVSATLVIFVPLKMSDLNINS